MILEASVAQPKPIIHSDVAIKKELILEASVELEKNMSDEVEEEGFDKDEMEEGEEFKEHEVGGPTNLPMKKLESCHANKSKKVMKSPLKKRTKKV